MGSGHKGHGHGSGLSCGHDDHDRGREHDPGRGGARASHFGAAFGIPEGATVRSYRGVYFDEET